MTGWQPIETAPKDGTLIFVYANRNGIHLAKLAFWMGRSDGWSEGWYSSTYSMESIEELSWKPTHWIPPPAPVRGK